MTRKRSRSCRLVAERPPSVPAPGVVPAFDAGWDANALEIERETVAAVAADPRWALLGWDCREGVTAGG